MIGELDATVGALLRSRVTRLRAGTPPSVIDEQVGFQPPDGAWVSVVDGIKRKSLNVFLVDVRENRKLRSNQRLRRFDQGVIWEEPAPARLDCHYAVTAWSPASEDQGKTTDEHDLLYEAARVLMDAQPLLPRAVWGASPPTTIVTLPLDEELPTLVLPPEGFPHLPHFWEAMGPNHRWRAPVYMVITLPVISRPAIAGAPVTTVTTEVQANGGAPDVLVHVGGTVLDATVTPARPVVGAEVIASTLAGERVASAHTGADGRFVLDGLRPVTYRLKALASGHGTVERQLPAPLPTDDYDLRFT